MSDKLCPNGHVYPADKAECPYCPKGQHIAGASAAQLSEYYGATDGKTQIFSQSTQGAGEKTTIFSNDFRQTGQPGVAAPPVNARKLVGWIVTFDFNPLGRDFKIYEGRNTIGKAKERDIVIDFDTKVSGHHLTLLYRAIDGFSFKDELSTNGTFLNGAFVDGGTIKDSDMLRIGDSNFLFRSIV